MYLNHLKTNPFPAFMEKLSSMKSVRGAKRLETTDLKYVGGCM